MVKHAVKKIFYNIGLDVKRLPSQNSNSIQFLHIGKCAGGQIGSLIKQINRMSGRHEIAKNGHDTFLRDIPEDARYFFSIRDPVSRFYSGFYWTRNSARAAAPTTRRTPISRFYSRKRKGQPRRYAEWTIFDEFAFNEFEEANDLAEALFSGGVMERKAVAAIKSIRHTAQNQFDWFYCCGSFLDVRPPVYIIRQENFDEDFQAFMIHANLEKYLDKVEIARDGVASHANDYSKTPPLSEKARQNLEIWYAQDMAFHRMCVDWIEAKQAQASGLERAAS